MKQSGNWVDRLERKIGKYAIPNLMKYLTGLYIVGFILSAISPKVFAEMLTLNFDKILHGQVWRLITFAVAPPDMFGGASSLIFAAIAIYMYYLIGSTLEQVWGAFRFNVFYFGGVLACIICAVVAAVAFGGEYSQFITTDYVFLSMFLAYAMTFPEQQFLVWFIIPIKAKWLGIFDVALIAFNVFEYIGLIVSGTFVNAAIVCIMNVIFSMINFLVLFYSFKYRGVSRATLKKNREYKKKVNSISKNRVHVCTTCGKTSKTNPEMEFRFCSRCDGNREYCAEHLFTHEHIKKIVINIDKDKSN